MEANRAVFEKTDLAWEWTTANGVSCANSISRSQRGSKRFKVLVSLHARGLALENIGIESAGGSLASHESVGEKVKFFILRRAK